jgi:tyrosinase
MVLSHFQANSISSLLTSSLLLTTSWASPRHNSALGAISTRQNAPFAVTGFFGEGIQPRLEIRDLQQNPDQWNLYILGLQRMQSMDQNDFLSWFQVAGKHW